MGLHKNSVTMLLLIATGMLVHFSFGWKSAMSQGISSMNQKSSSSFITPQKSPLSPFSKGKGHERSGKEGISAPVMLIGLALVFINCYWTTVVEIEWGSGDGSTLPLFVYPVFIIFVVAVLNTMLSKFVPKFAISQKELLVLYIMIVMSGTIVGESMFEGLFGSILHPIRYATEENEWRELFYRYIPKWFTVTDKSVLDGYYLGDSNLYESKQLKLWFTPFLSWGSLTFVLVAVMLCMNVLLRKRWAEEEKLAFPIIQLPVAMTRESGRSFFRNKTMWIAFSIALAIDILNGLNYIYPAVPYLSVKLKNINVFTEKPWNAIGWTPISFYPFAIGLAFFLPLDLSFSCWFFYIFRKFENILGSIAGWRTLPRFPYFDEQGSGAWVGLCIIALWASRQHLKEVFRQALGYNNLRTKSGEAILEDAKEPMRYRTAVLGIILGSLFLIFFCSKAGMSVWAILLFFGIYFALHIAITRVRVELGTPQEIYFVNPERIMVRTLGTRIFSPGDLTVMSYFYWFNRGYTCPPMANQMEGFRMGEISRTHPRKLLIAMVIAIIFSIIVSFWVNLHIRYKGGAEASVLNNKEFIGRESFEPLASWLLNPLKADIPGVLFMGIGLLFTFFLMAMRMRFFWWPFHPAGYALAVSYAMDYFWFAFLISWAIKSVLLKRGGITTHRKAIPFFLGLILGDYVGGSIWAIIGPVIVGIQTYPIFM
jgi:hypothetical protein